MCLPKEIWSRATNHGTGQLEHIECRMLDLGLRLFGCLHIYIETYAVVNNAPKTEVEINCVCQKKFGAVG